MRKKLMTSFAEPITSRMIKESLSMATTEDELLTSISGSISDYYAALGIGIAKILAEHFSDEMLRSHNLYVNPPEKELKVNEYAIVLLDKSVKQIHLKCDSGYVSVYSDGWTKLSLSGDTLWYLMGCVYATITNTRVNAYDFSMVEGESDRETTLMDYASAELRGTGLIEVMGSGDAMGENMGISCNSLDMSVDMKGVRVDGFAIQRNNEIGSPEITVHYGNDPRKVARQPWVLKSNNPTESRMLHCMSGRICQGYILPAHYEPIEAVSDIVSQIRAFLRRNDLENLSVDLIPKGDLALVDREELLDQMVRVERSFVRFLKAGGGDVLRRCFHHDELIEANILAFDGSHPCSAQEGKATYVLAHNMAQVLPGNRAYFFEHANGFVESAFVEFYDYTVGLTRDSYVRTHDHSAVYSLNGKNEAFDHSQVSSHGYNATACFDKASAIDYGYPVEITLSSPEARREPPVYTFLGFEGAKRIKP